jgi:hypothetical protein
MKRILFVSLMIAAGIAQADVVTDSDVARSQQQLDRTIKQYDQVHALNRALSIENNVLAPLGDALARSIYNEDDTIQRIQASGSYRAITCYMHSTPMTWIAGQGTAVAMQSSGTSFVWKEVSPGRFQSKRSDTFTVDMNSVRVEGETFFGEQYKNCRIVAEQNWNPVAQKQRQEVDLSKEDPMVRYLAEQMSK